MVDTVYGDGDYLTFRGFRVLAVDVSKLVLPDNAAVREEFGTIAWSNGKAAEIQGERPYALASVLYDVLNRVALDAVLGKVKAYEIDLAVRHLAYTRAGDLLTMDRNYPSYRMLAELSRHGRDFVVRCSAASFAEARRMLKGEGKASQVVTLVPCARRALRVWNKFLSSLSITASATARPTHAEQIDIETDDALRARGAPHACGTNPRG